MHDTPASDLWQQLHHTLAVDLRRHLIHLVSTCAIPLTGADTVLRRCDQPPLPRRWAVQVTGRITWRETHHSIDDAVHAFRISLHDQLVQACGPDISVQYPQPPQARMLLEHHRTGQGQCGLVEVTAVPQITVAVGEPGPETWAEVTVAVHQRLAAVSLDDPQTRLIHLDPDQPPATDLARPADADRGHQPPDGPVQAWQRQIRRTRTALVTALQDGDLGGRPAEHATYQLIDDVLTGIGLAGIAHAHQYQITVTIPLTVQAYNPDDAWHAAYQILKEASAAHPRCGSPITHADTYREPDIEPLTAGVYLVMWHEAYLVCLRAISSPLLAELAVRLHLSTLADTVPGIATVGLQSTYLGERVDHRLDALRD